MNPDDYYDLTLSDLMDAGAFEAKLDRRVRRAPRVGDVVFSADGRVHRVGDTPRSRRHEVVAPSTKEVARTMTTLEQRQEQLKRALMEYAGIAALLDRFGGQQPPVATVLRWVRYDNRTAEMVLDTDAADSREMRFTVTAPPEYVYLAFRAPDGAWYTTSLRGAVKKTWDALIEEIGDSFCEVATDWTEVPAPVKPAEESLDPVTWAKTMFGPKNEPAQEQQNGS